MGTVDQVIGQAISIGVPIYNAGSPLCYRIYEGTAYKLSGLKIHVQVRSGSTTTSPFDRSRYSPGVAQRQLEFLGSSMDGRARGQRGA